MTWTKLGQDFVEWMECLDAPPVSVNAMWLHTAALVYCNRRGLDGQLDRRHLGRVTLRLTPDELDAAVAELEQATVWDVLESGEGWQLDWSDQEPAAVVQQRRANAAARQARFRRHQAGLHDECDPRRCKAAATTKDEAVTRDVTDDKTRDVTGLRTVPIRTDPFRTDPKDSVRERKPGDGRLCPQGAIIGADGACCAECAATGEPPRTPHADASEAEAAS